MFKVTLPSLLTGAVVAALGTMVSIEPASAARITYDFTADVPTGTYQGSYKGNFSYDDTGLVRDGDLEFANPSKSGLTVNFNFLGKTYNEQADSGFNTSGNDQFPKAFFRSGNLLGLSFLVIPPTSDPGFMIVAKESVIPGPDTPLTDGFYVGTNPSSYGDRVGNVSYSLRSNSEAVPEPSEVAGTVVAIGLLGLGLKLRKGK
jgi:hypothetical protein